MGHSSPLTWSVIRVECLWGYSMNQTSITDRARLREIVDDEITGRAQHSPSHFRRRDLAVEQSLSHADEILQKAGAMVVQEIESFEEGSYILENPQSPVSENRGILDSIGNIVAVMARKLDLDLYPDIMDEPEVPPDEAPCIRYLAPEKWIWLLHQHEIRLSSPTEFVNDPFDSAMPTFSLRHLLNELIENSALATISSFWIEAAVRHWSHYERDVRAKYRISCWNLFNEHTSNLMWHQFGSGRTGVALLCPFGRIRDALYSCAANYYSGYLELDGEGLVDYLPKSRVKPPFFKRPEYKDEQEVRFVSIARNNQDVHIPLQLLIDTLDIELPPDAPAHHKESIRSGWQMLRQTLNAS